MLEVIYNTPYHIPLGLYIATYFYLTGVSAGSFVVSAVATLGGRTEYKPLGRIGAVAAPVALMIAPFFLMIDLEQPLRFWHLFFYFNWRSPITYGTFLLTIYPINGLLYAWFLFTGKMRLAKILGIIGIPLAVATHGYTGFILALGKGREFWSTALMPTLFIVSAVVSGIALLILLAAIRNRYFFRGDSQDRQRDSNLIVSLGKIMGAFIGFDLFLVFNDILVLLTSTEEALSVVHLILHGSFSPLFLGVEIFLGGIVPLFLVFLPGIGRKLSSAVTASVLTLIGVYAMRVVVVIAGQSMPLH